MIGATGVSFENLCIKGDQDHVVLISCSSRVDMLDCVIEGGSKAAVRVSGPSPFDLFAAAVTGSSSLFARGCSFQGREHGLHASLGVHCLMFSFLTIPLVLSCLCAIVGAWPMHFP